MRSNWFRVVYRWVDFRLLLRLTRDGKQAIDVMPIVGIGKNYCVALVRRKTKRGIS